MITICLWLWTGPGGAWGRYTIDHVNRAARMIRANLTLEHEIVCITDLHDGGAPYFDSGIRLVPIWDDLALRGRCWRRLKFFAPEVRQLLGERIAWIDLDCVVLGDLTPLFQRDEDLVLWRSQTTRGPYNGSMVLHTAGTRPEIWTDYSPSIRLQYPGSDQAWFAHILGDHMPVWTEQDGVHAYNRLRRHSSTRREPPDGTRIVFFPGTVKSNSHICAKVTPWVQDVLSQYGDFDEPEYRWMPRSTRARAHKRFVLNHLRRGVVVRE